MVVAETILCDRSDALEVIEDAKNEWIIEVLLELGVSEETVELGFSDESAVHREQYIMQMNELGIAIELYSNGEVDVYKKVWHTDERGEEGWLPTDDKQIVAQWKNPERVLKVDGRNLYYEIHLSQWSVKNMRI